jgi:hypothetical protein
MILPDGHYVTFLHSWSLQVEADQQITFWNDGQNGQHYVIRKSTFLEVTVMADYNISRNDALGMGGVV